ncbi:Trehalose-phosphatase [Bertholletia excelsa]
MTNQSVVVSDATAIPVVMKRGAVSNASAIAIYRSILTPWKKLPKKLETGRINSWVDSMRASSPTRRYCTPFSDAEDQIRNSWIVHHPSALTMFEKITEASKGKQIAIFLDYDGTLSPIVQDPDKAVISDEMRDAVRDVAEYFPTAIVSGRCRSKVSEFVKLSQLYYAGSHGMDIEVPAKDTKYRKVSPNGNQSVLFQPATKFLPVIEKVYKILLEKTKSTPGAKVEHNEFCLSVHYRCVDEKRWHTLAELVKSVVNEYPMLRLTQGRMVFEIRPDIKWDKGNAVEFLLESLGYANSDDVLPIYIGDDRTDEDAFKVLSDRGRGFGILVSKIPKETNASYTLQEPNEVMKFLQRLVEWKRSQSQEPQSL